MHIYSIVILILYGILWINFMILILYGIIMDKIQFEIWEFVFILSKYFILKIFLNNTLNYYICFKLTLG